jgi:hypothetical protein
MQDVRGDQDQAQGPRFPALDPEPSRAEALRRGLRSGAIAAAALVILAGAGGLTTYLVRQHTGSPAGAGQHPGLQAVQALPASAAPAGTILSQTQRGGLTVSGLRGQPPKLLMSLSSQVYVAAADSRYVAMSNGLLLSVGAHGQLSSTRMRNVNAGIWSPSALADHDQYVALENYNTSASQADGIPLSITSLVTGKAQRLGVGNDVAGDPAAAGVIASLAAPAITTGTSVAALQNGSWPDAKVVLRDAGKKDVLLASAEQLNEDIHLPASALTDFYSQPDPAGDKIAIVVQPLTGDLPAGVVVVTRTGHELFALSQAGRSVSVSWSPSGQSLAMAAQVPHGSVLHIWNAGGSISAQPFPRKANYGGCVWSPDGAWILCAVAGQHSNGEQWAVASARGGPMVVTTGPGYPITWLGTGQ